VIEKPFTAQCTLVESDVCNDLHFENALQASGPFDAVTIWLTRHPHDEVAAFQS
jgi:hypothetical protein